MVDRPRSPRVNFAGPCQAGTNFWCQIITTLVVIIISIGKALESLRDPTFLAFAIVGLLFGALLLFGYVKAKRQQNRERAEEEAQALREAEAEAAANKAMGRLGRD